MAKRRIPSVSASQQKMFDAAGDRLKRLRAALRRESLSHLLVTNPVDVGYLTGFLGGDSVLIVGSGKPVLISDSRYEEELGPFAPLVRVVMRRGPMTPAIADNIRKLHDGWKIDTLGLQSEHMTLAEEHALRAGLKKRRVPARLLRQTKGMVGSLRRVKGPEEIKIIKAAISLQQNALLAALGEVKPGMSELEFTAELEYQMKARGSIDPGFPSIVGAQANGSLPHYRPGRTPIKRNAPLLIDWGATWMGYRGDMTRTFALGRWPRELRDVYAIVHEAHMAGAAALKPGATGAEVDAAARRVIEKAGYGDRFGHGLGHGLGMDVHEAPGLNRLATDEVLEPGHVVTIEPGIYLPGVGGVRIEDDYAVTARGSKNLCDLPKDIDWATI
ncbi:MAG: aminopeptidase P family protein [Phycisphaeraceae bacterium]|nr:MAG: aminopeptidase P family protein [Phycisphaeraceae bacterium]